LKRGPRSRLIFHEYSSRRSGRPTAMKMLVERGRKVGDNDPLGVGAKGPPKSTAVPRGGR
jgi:hypothetical protein